MLESSPVAWMGTVWKVKSPSWEDSVLLSSKLRSSAMPCNWVGGQVQRADFIKRGPHVIVLCLTTLVVREHSHALIVKDTVRKNVQQYAVTSNWRIT
jgi:hypothetical protein